MIDRLNDNGDRSRKFKLVLCGILYLLWGCLILPEVALTTFCSSTILLIGFYFGANVSGKLAIGKVLNLDKPQSISEEEESDTIPSICVACGNPIKNTNPKEQDSNGLDYS